MIKKYLFPLTAIVVFALLIFSCATEKKRLESALASITAEDLTEDVVILSSDEFEGRFPASEGEEKTVAHLKAEFEKAGLKPGNGESFFQEVPLVVITADPDTKLEIKGKGKTAQFAYADEFIASTLRVVERVSLVNSEMVFVGYGIVAPEYNWNDYEGIDVRGKTLVILINDPGFATEDPELFNGRAMTYYGRWTYKFEEAARQGAEGALIIHETEPAAYPWDVVRNGWSGPQFNLISEDNNLSRCAVEGWITLETAQWLFKNAGLDYYGLKLSAAKQGFKAISMDLKSSLTLNNTIKQTKSRNVIGLLPGSDRADEYIIYTAHWDHFGIDPTLEGDQIFNGALDNATGTSALIELAEAFQKLHSPLLRSILFLAVTAEEQGLLGSEYYATHPIYPPTKTVAAINMDALNIYGRMKDITVIGFGNSELDDYVEAAASEQGRRIRPDPRPERGSFYRSDHFSFAKQGIPALYTSSGVDHIEHGEEWGLAKRDEYVAKNYHKPSDEYDPNWDLSGAIDDLRLLFKIGYRLSMESTFPNWKEGTEFKAKRDADIRASKESTDRNTP
jgi:Zn-dependent M28 family amino/carboxypeptidase